MNGGVEQVGRQFFRSRVVIVVAPGAQPGLLEDRQPYVVGGLSQHPASQLLQRLAAVSRQQPLCRGELEEGLVEELEFCARPDPAGIDSSDPTATQQVDLLAP